MHDLASLFGQRHGQATQLREDRLLSGKRQADNLVGLGRDVRRRAMWQTYLEAHVLEYLHELSGHGGCRYLLDCMLESARRAPSTQT